MKKGVQHWHEELQHEKNFADFNPEQDFQPFNEEKNSHLQTKIS